MNILYCFRPTALASALLLGADAAQAADTPADTVPLANSSSAPLPLDELRTSAGVLDRVKAACVEPVDGKALLENAIKSMLSNLDPHPAYLGPEDFTGLQKGTSGELGGLGIEVGSEGSFIRVISPIDDIPVARAGIQPGGLIVQIDGEPTKDQSMIEAVNSMRGKVGSPIALTIVYDSGRPFDVELKRAIIKVKSVKNQVLEPSYAYLRITQFQVNTGEEVVKALNRLRKNNKGRLRGLVLNLRNNPGGVLQPAVEIANAFLTKGLIVYIKGRTANSELRFSADPADPSDKVPLVVLISGGNASAAEIIAGALQNQKRAILMGTGGFDKGSVQTVLPLNNDRALKFTTALYYTPNGHPIQTQGIIPDIEIGRARVTQEWSSFEGLEEADLQGHLASGNGGADRPTGKRAAPSKCPQDSDHQLSQAPSLLRDLGVTRNN